MLCAKQDRNTYQLYKRMVIQPSPYHIQHIIWSPHFCPVSYNEVKVTKSVYLKTIEIVLTIHFITSISVERSKDFVFIIVVILLPIF